MLREKENLSSLVYPILFFTEALADPLKALDFILLATEWRKLGKISVYCSKVVNVIKTLVLQKEGRRKEFFKKRTLSS